MPMPAKACLGKPGVCRLGCVEFIYTFVSVRHIVRLATMIALLVFFIATTDHPYSGSNAIKPVSYEIVTQISAGL
jgi:hypothetical protein